MRGTAYLFVIVAAGIPLGFVARALFESDPPRVETALELFVEICLPLKKGERFVAPPELHEYQMLPAKILYVDEASLLDVQVDNRSCSVNDTLRPFTHDEHFELRSGLSELVAQRFPNLPEEANTSLNGPKNLFWFEFPTFHEKRWGISIITFDYLSPTSTMMSYYFKD